MRLTGAVMAGGKSTRLGRDKALLEIGGRTLLARTVVTLREVADEVLVIGPSEREAHAEGARVVPDAYPDTGPLGGIATALEAAAFPRVIVVACDMPFLNAKLLAFLCDFDPGADAIIPRVDGATQQLHAVYSRNCLPIMREELAGKNYRIGVLIARLNVHYVEETEIRAHDPELRAFTNINTPDDLAEAERVLLSHQPRQLSF
jgi:molybdenum cofactor guanylyltransferase